MARPTFMPDTTVPLPVDLSPNLTTCLILGLIQTMMPNGIRIQSAILSQCTGQTDALTDRSSTGKSDHYRPLHFESDAA